MPIESSPTFIPMDPDLAEALAGIDHPDTTSPDYYFEKATVLRRLAATMTGPKAEHYIGLAAGAKAIADELGKEALENSYRTVRP